MDSRHLPRAGAADNREPSPRADKAGNDELDFRLAANRQRCIPTWVEREAPWRGRPLLPPGCQEGWRILHATQGRTAMIDPGFADFDFLIGEWDVENEYLNRRLAGSDEWETFPATSRAEKVMDGHANLDQMFVPARGFTGMTLRLYDPQTKLWSIYWSDTKSFRLFPPTIGKFEDGRGVFFGDDVEDGTPVKVRFLWTPGTSPRWEQSMSADGGATWELNWVMKFTRRQASLGK
jgi:hypothetical protein